MPYGLIADLHMHNWSAFSSVNSIGINTRLEALLMEVHRCANEVRKAGGGTIVLAGDIFHVRGSIAPSVLNPVRDVISELIGEGFEIIVLAGNHDLESKESNRLGSAITALEMDGCIVVNDALRGSRVMASQAVLIPWIQNVTELKLEIEKARDAVAKPAEIDLIIHAPIDGVIPGLPDHGLDDKWLGSLGFKRVFAGHYHNHKDFGNGVYSIGALAHHTWSDVDSKAGFLIVSDDDVKWFKSHAPEFVEINAATDPADIPLLVDGNYVRAKINSTKQKEVEELRCYLTDCGAKGVTILAQKEASATPRAGATISAGASLETSVNDFIKAQSYSNAEKLAVLCQDILTNVRSAA